MSKSLCISVLSLSFFFVMLSKFSQEFSQYCKYIFRRSMNSFPVMFSAHFFDLPYPSGSCHIVCFSDPYRCWMWFKDPMSSKRIIFGSKSRAGFYRAVKSSHRWNIFVTFSVYFQSFPSVHYSLFGNTHLLANPYSERISLVLCIQKKIYCPVHAGAIAHMLRTRSGSSSSFIFIYMRLRVEAAATVADSHARTFKQKFK